MPSMGSVGDAYDNTMAESLFATLSAKYCSDDPSKLRLKPAWRCSNGSKTGTTRIVVLIPPNIPGSVPDRDGGHPSYPNHPRDAPPVRALVWG